MVVEHQMRPRHVGQVGGDVAAGDLHLAVLHVLGVHELDVVDQVQLVEQDGTGQAVEVAARDEPVFLVGHGELRDEPMKK
jgi:hypothetical protein